MKPQKHKKELSQIIDEKEQILNVLYELFHEYCEISEQLYEVLSKEDKKELKDGNGFKRAGKLLRKYKRI